MNTYMMKSPVYYAVSIQGCQNKFGWYLTNEDEIDEFASKFDMHWSWNARRGILTFKDIGYGVSLKRPNFVKIGDAVTAYDDLGIWRVQVWTSEELEKKFIKVG